LVYLKGDSAIS